VLRPPEVRALERLPATHAEALRLREHGETDEAIAVHLGIEPEAVAPLVRVAEAKLAALADQAARHRVAPEHRAP
jgi:DNA-directed RNA polymerase specialized sigma24 family protein